MTSASTKRRHKRSTELVEKWKNIPPGHRVTVCRDNGEVLKTVTESRAQLIHGKYAMIAVRGIPGNTRLESVNLGWHLKPPKPMPGFASEVMRECSENCASARSALQKAGGAEMISASTKRRPNPTIASVRKSAARLQQFCHNWLNGVDSNIRYKRHAAAMAHVDVVRIALNDLPDMIEAALAAGGRDSTATIQRLRVAMVQAMDDADAALDGYNSKALRGSLHRIHKSLKRTLEKK